MAENQNLRKLTIAGLIAIVSLGTWYLWPTPPSRPTIGVILAETGPAEFIGRPEAAVLRALQKQLLETNSVDPPFVLDFKDSGGRTAHAISLFDNFAAQENVLAVIGPSTSGESLALVEAADKHGLPLLSLAASEDIVRRQNGSAPLFVFKFAQNDSLAATRLLSTMHANKHRTVALLYSDDGFGKSGASAFRRAASGVSDVSIVHDISFKASLDRPETVAASIPDNVDAVVIWGTSPGPALLVKAVRSLPLKSQIYLSHGNASRSFIEDSGLASEGAIVVGSRILKTTLDTTNPADSVLVDFANFWKTAGLEGEPSHFGGHARDAYGVLVAAFTNGATTRDEIRREIEETQGFRGVTGTFSFSQTNHAGLDATAFETYQIRNGSFVLHKP